jgi:sulfur-carrier protein adenylyltransferase/sulfurtransferase
VNDVDTPLLCTSRELAERLGNGDSFRLLDVRTPVEWELARIEEAVLIPLHELTTRLNELDSWREKEIIVICHVGIRSAMAQRFLLSHGFKRVRNLTGGIDAYAIEADPEIARY